VATWERNTYALPGEAVHWPHEVKLTRPFFYSPGPSPLDDPGVDEVCRVRPFTWVAVIACFPERTRAGKDWATRGAIVLVPDRGLWWWRWP
jgi:hypothetical protein